MLFTFFCRARIRFRQSIVILSEAKDLPFACRCSIHCRWDCRAGSDAEIATQQAI